MLIGGTNNGNGNGNVTDPMTPRDEALIRLERSLDAQEKQFQATRDDVNALKGQQSIIQRDLGTLNSSIQSLSAKMDEKSRPNIPAISLGATLLIAIVPVMWFIVSVYTANVVSPVKTAVDISTESLHHVSDNLRTLEVQTTASSVADVSSRADRVQLNERLRLLEASVATEIGDRRTGSAATKIALAEVETQLRAVCNTENLRAAQQERINSLQWEKAHPGERYPNGIFYSPCIAHDTPIN